MSGSDGKVFDETMASAPAASDARASATMSVVEGVSLHHTGTVATSLTTCVTIEISPSSWPMFDPMSLRSMCGHDRFSSKASTPASWQAVARVCQCCSSRSLPEPAMIDATRIRSGCASLMRRSRGSHQSIVLSEISSQFHEECSAVPERFCIDSRYESASARRNFVFGPATLVTGCRPIVLVTTPPQPASNARMMFASDSVGGADESRNGFSNRSPVNVTVKSAHAARSSAADLQGKRRLYARAPRRAAGVGRFERVGRVHGKAEVAQPAIAQGVNPPVDGQRLPPGPGILHHGRLADVPRLLDDVQLAEQVDARLGVRGLNRLAVQPPHVLDVAQPVVDEPEPAFSSAARTPPQP
jgi:hypothetical protein